MTALPLVVYFTSGSSGIRRALGIVTAVAVVVAIGLTFTRGAWLALAAIFSSARRLRLEGTSSQRNHHRRLTVAARVAIVFTRPPTCAGPFTRLVALQRRRRPPLALEIRALNGRRPPDRRNRPRRLRNWLRTAPGPGLLADRMEYNPDPSAR